MTTRVAITITLLFAVVSGLLDGYFESRGIKGPKPLDLLLSVSIMITGYLWYRRDAQSRQFRGSVFLGGAIVIFSVLAIPYYLARSRERGSKIKSVLSFVGLFVLSTCFYVASVSAIAGV